MKKGRLTITIPKQRLRVLKLLARGFTIAEVAAEMGLTYRTVTFYLEIMRTQLGFKKTSALTIWFMQQNDKK